MITVIGSLKGGSGKSTVTFNLAVWLSMAGVGVKVIDADPQATLTDVSEVRSEERYEPKIKVGGPTALDGSKLHNSAEVLIDVGTADMEAMKRALTLADRIVVPVPPSQADIWSTQRFVQFIKSSIKRDQPPEIVGFINRADTNRTVRESDEAAAALVTLPGLKFLRPRLAQRTIYRRSFSEGLAVFELEPRGKGAREMTALTAALYPHLVS
jgi:chromosome partitioning protein